MRQEILKTYKIYIGGQFPRTESGRYYPLRSHKGALLANVCLSSRKDLRNAVVAARSAFAGWSVRTAFNRSQVMYRMAEMLESRRAQFVSELVLQGSSAKEAGKEVSASIDLLVYYAGWCDKYAAVFSSVNPVSSPHFNFSVPEPMGVIGLIAPEETSLLGIVSAVAPAIAGGNTCVALASERRPLCAISFAEVIHSSDVPGGVVNILTGTSAELHGHFASHMDINALIYYRSNKEEIKAIGGQAALNVKRVFMRSASAAPGPYLILDTQEIKTTWHPVEHIGSAKAGY
jgi:acyl-CoA reductase-like NAD-dependent aldehyde dehydrogenase